MLQVYNAKDQEFLQRFISNTMCAVGWEGWAFMQPDIGKVTFPSKFVIIEQPKIKAATIQFLH